MRTLATNLPQNLALPKFSKHPKLSQKSKPIPQHQLTSFFQISKLTTSYHLIAALSPQGPALHGDKLWKTYPARPGLAGFYIPPLNTKSPHFLEPIHNLAASERNTARRPKSRNSGCKLFKTRRHISICLLVFHNFRSEFRNLWLGARS